MCCIVHNKNVGKRLFQRDEENKHCPNGLFIDNKEIPITYDLFAGNTNDTKPSIPNIERIKDLTHKINT